MRGATALCVSIFLSGCQIGAEWAVPSRHRTCGELVAEVVKSSQQNAARNPRNWPIVGIEKVAPYEGEYECTGIARLSSGESIPLQFGATDTHDNQAPVYSF